MEVAAFLFAYVRSDHEDNDWWLHWRAFHIMPISVFYRYVSGTLIKSVLQLPQSDQQALQTASFHCGAHIFDVSNSAACNAASSR